MVVVYYTLAQGITNLSCPRVSLAAQELYTVVRSPKRPKGFIIPLANDIITFLMRFLCLDGGHLKNLRCLARDLSLPPPMAHTMKPYQVCNYDDDDIEDDGWMDVGIDRYT